MPVVVLEQLTLISSDKKRLETYKVTEERLKELKEELKCQEKD